MCFHPGTPNSTLETTITTNNNSNSIANINSSTIISADSSVASSVSLDEDEESPAKVKKKDDAHVSRMVLFKNCMA